MNGLFIEVDIRLQQLYLWEAFPDGDMLIRQYPVSTAANGAGEQAGSHCTPRGRHRIAEKIGAGAPLGTAFKSREPTGEIWTPELDAEIPGRDWILTRILWLQGLEPGRNQGDGVDSHARYIYIHGTNEEHKTRHPGVARLHPDAECGRGGVVRTGGGGDGGQDFVGRKTP